MPLWYPGNPGTPPCDSLRPHADGDLAGQPGGDDPTLGFTDAWSNPKTGGTTGFVSTEAAPLDLPDGTDLPSSPRHVQHAAGSAEAGWARRSLETASVDFGAEDTVFYVSAQMRKSDGGGTSGEWLQVQLADSGANGSPFFMGFSSREQVHLGAEPGTENSDIAVGSDLVAGRDYFFVAKIITHATGEDQLFLGVYGGTAEDGFADALPGEEPMEWHLTNTVDYSGVADALQITCGPNATGAIDGIRFGTSWESVTAIPEPEAMFLFVMATAIGIFKRR